MKSGQGCAICRREAKGRFSWKARLEAGAARPSGWVLRSLSLVAGWRSHSGNRSPGHGSGPFRGAAKVFAAGDFRP
jgi:hypothetical protein